MELAGYRKEQLKIVVEYFIYRFFVFSMRFIFSVQRYGGKFFKEKCGFERIYCLKDFNEWFRDVFNSLYYGI